MDKTEKGSENVHGFFVILNPDDVRQMDKERVVNVGRSGVYYKKEELISTLIARPLPKNELEELWAKMHIIEVQTQKKHRINENGSKFCIKGNGAIPIKKIERFLDAKKDLQMQA
jgi:hypothetical protein